MEKTNFRTPFKKVFTGYVNGFIIIVICFRAFTVCNIGALFIWGLLFSFVYYKTKSLEASILLHSLTNLTSRFKEGYEYIEINGMHFFKFIIVMVICALIIYLIISYLNRYGEVEKNIDAIDAEVS